MSRKMSAALWLLIAVASGALAYWTMEWRYWIISGAAFLLSAMAGSVLSAETADRKRAIRALVQSGWSRCENRYSEGSGTGRWRPFVQKQEVSPKTDVY